MADLGAALGGLASGGGLIGKAIVQLELESKKYLAELKASQAETQATANGMGSSFKNFGTYAGAAVAGVGLAIGAMAVKGISDFQNVASEVRTLEKQLGITAEQASVLRAQGEALGVGVDKLSIGFGIFAKHLVAGDDVLQQYGISVQRTADGSIDFQNVIAQVHDRFEEMGPSVDRTALAMNLFGRSGKSLIPLLAADSDEMANFAKQAEDAGLIMSETDVDAARELAIAQRQLGEAFTGIEVSLGRALVPALTEVVGLVTDMLTAVQPLLDVLGKLGGVLHFVGEAMSFVLFPAEKFVSTIAQGVQPTDQMIDILGKAAEAQMAAGDAFATGATEADNATYSLGHYGEAVTRFAGMTKKELEDWESSATDSFSSVGGGLDNVGNEFTLTAEEAVKAMRKMANQAQTAARDLAKLTDLPGKEEFKAWLIEQGPAAVHAFVEGTAKQRGEFIKAWKGYESATQASVNRIRSIAASGGSAVGAALIQGITAGFAAYQGSLYNTVDQVINNAIAAAQHAAGAHSPSRKMWELGKDLVLGLKDGLTENQQQAVEAAQKVIDNMVKGVQAQIDKLKPRLDALLSKASDLRSQVSGGFGSFLDISGGFTQQLPGAEPGSFIQGAPDLASIKAFFAAQVQAAQQFADVLKRLQKGGASAALLSQIAGAGPEALPFAQALLSGGPGAIASVSAQLGTIQGLATATAKGLSEAYFGKKIDELKDELHDLNRVLKVLEKPQRLEIAFRPGADQALRQLILQVVQQVTASYSSV